MSHHPHLDRLASSSRRLSEDEFFDLLEGAAGEVARAYLGRAMFEAAALRREAQTYTALASLPSHLAIAVMARVYAYFTRRQLHNFRRAMALWAQSVEDAQ